MIKLTKTIFLLMILLVVGLGQVLSQDKPKVKKVNFGYSTNPTVKSKKAKNNKKTSSKKINSAKAKALRVNTKKISKKENLTLAKKTLEVAKKTSRDSLPPTEIYKIGVGDVLFISLQNSPGSSKYYTVLNDGTIDYPLAGELVSVTGLTTDEVEEYLREKVKLYENPEVSVKVREFSSHKISVLGLVEKPGDIFLRREAVPFYVIKTQAIVKPEASKVVIKRKGNSSEEFELKETKFTESLIYPGDIIEFTGEFGNNKSSSGLFYYISGEVVEVGQKSFIKGMSLYQAIIASGGLKDSKVKKVIIRRKNEKGLLKTKTFKLKDIKKGKTPDPLLQAGDLIEVGR